MLPLTDEEYNIMLRKIMGQSSIPVIEKTKVDRKVERKYYRWLKQGRSLTVGPSLKTIYIDGKKLIRKEELRKLVEVEMKRVKNSGNRKLTGRIKERVISCSHEEVKMIKKESRNLKLRFHRIRILFK